MTDRLIPLTLLGACLGTGLAILATTALKSPKAVSPQYPDREHGPTASPWHRLPRARRLIAAGAAGTAAYVLTGWPTLAVLAACGAHYLPNLLRAGRGQDVVLTRVEAVATWIELLRDTLSASAGLFEAIRATAPLAPGAIRPAAVRLSEHLGRDPHNALRAFAEEVADPVADRVVIALGFAVTNPTRDLAGLLTALAANAREQAAMGARIQAARARTRTAVRVITGVTLGMGLLLALLDRKFLAPYGSGIGQLALAVIGALFAGGFAWLDRLSKLPEPPRLLAPPSVPAQRTSPADASAHRTPAESH